MTAGSDRAGGTWRARLTCRGRAVAVHTRSWRWGHRWLRPYRARWCPARRSESGQRSRNSVTTSPQQHSPCFTPLPKIPPCKGTSSSPERCSHKTAGASLSKRLKSMSLSKEELLDICRVSWSPKAAFLGFPKALAAAPAGVWGRLRVPPGPRDHLLLKVIRLQRPGIRQSTARLQAIFSSCCKKVHLSQLTGKPTKDPLCCLPGSIYRSYSELQVTAGCLHPSS